MIRMDDLYASVRNGILAAGIVTLALASSVAEAADVPFPKVAGPIPAKAAPGDPSHDYPQLAAHFDLATHGYVEEEFFYEGTATNYATPAGQTGTVISANHPYKTRMIVRRPADPKKFNGTVLVDWLNVSNNMSFDLMWQLSFEHIMREGYAYVGLSTQRIGLEGPPTGLKLWSPARYGSLDVTDGGKIKDDGLSFDIYSQGGQALKNTAGVRPLGTLRPQRLLAMGVSQSQGYLARYYNSVQPLANVYDGYLMFLSAGNTMRTDIDVKVFKLNTENDLIALREAANRQPDTNRMRTWEIAGGGHASWVGWPLRLQLFARDGLQINDLNQCEKRALSLIPNHYVLDAAYEHLVRWVRDGVAPPTAPRIEMTSITPPVAARDKLGNALGGLRLAEHDVPTATNTGVNGGPAFCFVYGSHEVFDPATLDALYPTHRDYVAKVTRVTEDNVRKGYILPVDAKKTIAAAQNAFVGRQP